MVNFCGHVMGTQGKQSRVRDSRYYDLALSPDGSTVLGGAYPQLGVLFDVFSGDQIGSISIPGDQGVFWTALSPVGLTTTTTSTTVTGMSGRERVDENFPKRFPRGFQMFPYCAMLSCSPQHIQCQESGFCIHLGSVWEHVERAILL